MDGRWNLERKRCFLAFQVSHQSNPHCSVNCLHTNCCHFGHKNFSVFDVRRNSDLSLFAIAVSKTGYFSVTDCESDLQSGLSLSCQRLSDDILGSFWLPIDSPFGIIEFDGAMELSFDQRIVVVELLGFEGGISEVEQRLKNQSFSDWANRLIINLDFGLSRIESEVLSRPNVAGIHLLIGL